MCQYNNKYGEHKVSLDYTSRCKTLKTHFGLDSNYSCPRNRKIEKIWEYIYDSKKRIKEYKVFAYKELNFHEIYSYDSLNRVIYSKIIKYDSLQENYFNDDGDEIVNYTHFPNGNLVMNKTFEYYSGSAKITLNRLLRKQFIYCE